MTRQVIAPNEAAHRELRDECAKAHAEARTWTAIDLIKDEWVEIATLFGFLFCAGFVVIGGIFAAGAGM